MLNLGGRYTQGDASRLRRFGLPWAGMLRPLRGKGLFQPHRSCGTNDREAPSWASWLTGRPIATIRFRAVTFYLTFELLFLNVAAL
ncbi:MAG: hypothetical protein FJ295_03760 [Planctomycetes bacterium]|nr:hypothetical protein [Planctomycetota bacterium]